MEREKYQIDPLDRFKTYFIAEINRQKNHKF